MSRVAKMPVDLPTGVKAEIGAEQIVVQGPLGSLRQRTDAGVAVHHEGSSLRIEAVGESRSARAMSGTMRALLANMVHGVSKGWEKKLTLVGVGYRAQAQGASLNLSLGFSHPVVHSMPEGITVTTPTQTEILIKGTDRQRVGQVAAEIRAYRSPEPYKGKGVRYANEVVVIKQTKNK